MRTSLWGHAQSGKMVFQFLTAAVVMVLATPAAAWHGSSSRYTAYPGYIINSKCEPLSRLPACERYVFRWCHASSGGRPRW